MDPAFLLPQQPAPVFGRTTNFEYKKVLPDPTWNANAPAGRHTFRWQNQAGEWWVPAQSYLRLRLAFLVCDGANRFRPMTPADGVAPVMNLPAHLFSRMEYYMDGHKLSDLQDHIPQIDTMKNRLSKSKAWFSSVGARSCFWDPNFANRQKQICPDFQSKATGVVQQGKLVSERVVVLNGSPINLKGQQFGITAASGSTAGTFTNEYKALLGNLLQRELGSGIGAGSPALAASPAEFIGVTPAEWIAAEHRVRPQWVRGRSGHYTYYCVSTGLNHLEVNYAIGLGQGTNALRVQNIQTAYAGNRYVGDQFVNEAVVEGEERKKNMLVWLDSISLKKRVLFLHGSSENQGNTKRAIEYGDADMMATMPLRTHKPWTFPAAYSIAPPRLVLTMVTTSSMRVLQTASPSLWSKNSTTGKYVPKWSRGSLSSTSLFVATMSPFKTIIKANHELELMPMRTSLHGTLLTRPLSSRRVKAK